MRFLTPSQLEDDFGKNGFRVAKISAYCHELVLDPVIAKDQLRVGCSPPSVDYNLAVFSVAINSWLTSHTGRLLWIDNWNLDFPYFGEMFILSRRGLGEHRVLSEAPGHYFNPHPYFELDETAISPEEKKELTPLVGMVTLIILLGWNGWLVSEGSVDRIEFWEGNIFFHSKEKDKLVLAENIMKRFGCSKKLV